MGETFTPFRGARSHVSAVLGWGPSVAVDLRTLAFLLLMAHVASGCSTDEAAAPTTQTAGAHLDQAYNVWDRSVLRTEVASPSTGVHAGFASSPTMRA